MRRKKALAPPCSLTTMRRRSTPLNGARTFIRYARGTCKESGTRYYVAFPEIEQDEFTDLNSFFQDCAHRFIARRKQPVNSKMSPVFSSLCCSVSASRKRKEMLKIQFAVKTRNKSGREHKKTYRANYEMKNGHFTNCRG